MLCFVLLTSLTPLHAQTPQTTKPAVHYTLGVGDKLKVTIYNQKDLTGEYVIDGAGNLSLPLIDTTIKAKGLSLKALEERVIDTFKPDYLLNPKVSIQVLNYRPYYILGEIKNASSYPYVNGITYLNAVVIAGGFTYRAKESYVFVIRDTDPKQQEIKATLDQLVAPGDIIRVSERYF